MCRVSEADPSALERLRAFLEQDLPQGQPFTPRHLSHLGTPAEMHRALKTLTEHGPLRRVCRGVYVRPLCSPWVGEVTPGPWKIAEALTHGHRLSVNGAEACVALRLSTQCPVRPLYLTDGPGHTVTVNRLRVTIKRVPAHELLLCGTPAGLALTALYYLGPHEVTGTVLEKIRTELGEEEFRHLTGLKPRMPAWMAAVFPPAKAARENGLAARPPRPPGAA